MLFSLLLSACADWLSGRTPLPRSIALAVTILGLLSLIAAIGLFLAPRVANQVQELSHTLPIAVRDLMAKIGKQRWGTQVIDAVKQWPAGGRGGALEARIAGIFSSGLGFFVNSFILIFGTVYFAANPGTYQRGVVLLFPPEYRPRLEATMTEAAETLRWWMVGKVLLMAYVAVVTTVGLMILDLPMAITLGLFAGLMDFIPNLGPFISFIPAALIAITIDPMTLLWVSVIYYGAQFTENYILTPIVQKRVADLPPAVTIFSQITLGILFGGLGLLFATPLAAATLIFIRRLHVDAQTAGSE